jgi:hypothetical protein
MPIDAADCDAVALTARDRDRQGCHAEHQQHEPDPEQSSLSGRVFLARGFHAGDNSEPDQDQVPDEVNPE